MKEQIKHFRAAQKFLEQLGILGPHTGQGGQGAKDRIKAEGAL